MNEEKQGCALEVPLALLVLLLTIPFYLSKTIFNKCLDTPTRIIHGIISIPSAIMIFFFGIVFLYGVVWFFIAFLSSDAWPVGVFGIFVLISVIVKIVGKIKGNKE